MGTLATLALAAAPSGLLVAGTRRAFWLGESGCLFAGVLVATLVIAVDPATPAPLSVAVLLPVVAVPVLNLALVTFDRLRRRRPLTALRPDGLPHLLRAISPPWVRVVLALAVVQALVSSVVVLADRGNVSFLVSAIVTVVVVASALPLAVQAARRPPPGPTLTTRIVGIGLVVLVAVAVVPAALGLAFARREALAGATAAERGLAAAREGDAAAAASAFSRPMDA